MGDVRYEEPYERVRDSESPGAVIRSLTDAEVILALGAASRHKDDYLANVLTTEALNRQRRLAALFAGVAFGAAFFVSFRLLLSLLFAAAPQIDAPETFRIGASLVLLLGGGIIALVAYARAKHQAITSGV